MIKIIVISLCASLWIGSSLASSRSETEPSILVNAFLADMQNLSFGYKPLSKFIDSKYKSSYLFDVD